MADLRTQDVARHSNYEIYKRRSCWIIKATLIICFYATLINYYMNYFNLNGNSFYHVGIFSDKTSVNKVKNKTGDKNILLDQTKRKCAAKNVSLSETPLPLTGLVSFPGSGNTWTRHLLQQMTGLGTSSVYCDKRLLLNGFPYECHKLSNRTLAVKTHLFGIGHLRKLKRIVLLIRNPFDAFLAYAKFRSAGHTGNPTKTKLTEVIHKTFGISLRLYTSVVNDTIENFKGPVHILLYEQLKADTAKELRKVADFLKVNITQYDIDCTVKLQEGNFHRKSALNERIKLFKLLFSKNELIRIRGTAIITEKLLKKAYGIDVDLRGEYKLVTD